MEKQSYVLSYRKKHPRCRYCKFKKIIVPDYFGRQYSYHKCILKDKVLIEYLICDFLSNIQGCFCRWFKTKEDNIDI